ncbi:ESX secretion-associated protein EspG [Saccharopolyspora erythraea]|uniref:ESX secretion-associated protein EspG n=1 Tax=Saccharopolyspora erythraea TaxID=1836 RepID=UPI001BAD9A92|nr:ESX secretion-associated protein EspG [Saccharopolyspora erythraea]QUH05149.1 ESX secretion-associated protein EspG [Saccharopolyspora erythraea]
MSERWRLPPLWFDLCWEIGGFDEQPFPIAVRSHGQTLEERAVLKQRTLPELEAAGLMSGTALVPRFAGVLARIAKPGLWVEGLWMPDDTNPSPVRLLSVVAEAASILLVQAPGEAESHGGDLHISVLQRTSVAAAVVQGMPATPPGHRPPVAVPVSAFAPRQDESYENVDLMDSSTPARQQPGERVLREMVDAQHFRDGQFTANLRDRMGRTHRSRPLKWFDAFEPLGRYGFTQRHRSGSEPELVVAPLGPAEVVTGLENRVAEVRGAAR